MKPASFRYHAPKTLAEAVAVLAEVAPDDGRVLAGGQSLVPIMAFRLAKPTHLVDINGIKELAKITVADGKLRVGACVRHAAFYEPVCEGPLGRLLATVVRSIAHHPIRTRGTFCGSVAHADPASEWCAVVATLDAEMVATSNRGERIIAAKDYFAGIMTTALNDEEMLTEVRLPLLLRRHACRLPGILPPRRRLCAEHGGGDLSSRERQDRRCACRHRRRRAVCAPYRRSRSSTRTANPPGRKRSRPRLKPPPRRSIRLRISRPAPSIGAISSAP